MQKRAALYIRVSHEEQALKGYSLQAQQKRLTEYAKEKGYAIVDIYKDEGISARKKPSRRIEFMRMLEDVHDRKIDIILFIKLDRWFRNISDYYKYQAILDKYNVEWETTEEDYNTSTAQGRLYLNIKLSIAQNESDTTSERIKFVFQDKIKRREVLSGHCPLGYKIVDKHMVKDDKAPIVLDIFNTYKVTHSMRATMLDINARYALGLTYRNIFDILSNETYTGLKYGIPDFAEPIISTQLYQEVQDIRANNSLKLPRSSKIYLFSSLLYCPCCGRRLVANSSKDITYYRCNNYTLNKTCSFVSIRESNIEASLLSNLKTLINGRIIQTIEENKRIAATVKPSVIKDKLARLKELYVDGMISREEYNKDFTILQEQLTASTMQSKKQDISKLQRLLDSDINAIYSNYDMQHKQLFWQNLLKDIRVNEVKQVISVVFR